MVAFYEKNPDSSVQFVYPHAHAFSKDSGKLPMTCSHFRSKYWIHVCNHDSGLDST